MEVVSGKAFTIAIAKMPLPKTWGWMELYESLRPIVEEIQTATFIINTKFNNKEC